MSRLSKLKELRNKTDSQLILLCYKKRTPQKGQPGSWRRMWRATAMRSVAIEAGLCRS